MEERAVSTKLNDKMALKVWVNNPSVVDRFTTFFGGDKKKSLQFLGGLMALSQTSTDFSKVAPSSIIKAASVAASLDLSVVPGLGLCAIIPYGGQAQFQVMTNGLVQLAFRSGQVASLNACEIYADEFNGFDKIKGELKELKDHDWSCTEVVGYAAYMKLTNGGEHTEYWPKGKVEAHRKKFSKAKNSPWDSNFDAMGKKTVLKYLLNHYCPKDAQLQRALDADQSIIMDYNDDGSFTALYADNPENDIVTVYSEEETNERTDYISQLGTKDIRPEMIVKVTKGARSIDDVPTSRLKELVEEYC